MCLAAKTPSTMAQQKAAITPKLIKTIEATSCGGNKTKVSVSFLLLLLLETKQSPRDCHPKQNSGLPLHEDVLCNHAGIVGAEEWGRQGRDQWSTLHFQSKLRHSLFESVSTKWRGRRLLGIQHTAHGIIWLHSQTQKNFRPLTLCSPIFYFIYCEIGGSERGSGVCVQDHHLVYGRIWYPPTPSPLSSQPIIVGSGEYRDNCEAPQKPTKTSAT